MNFMPNDPKITYVDTHGGNDRRLMFKKFPSGSNMRRAMKRGFKTPHSLKPVPVEVWKAYKIRMKGFMPAKQWSDWCRKLGFRTHGRAHRGEISDWFYLKGRGHVWRINDREMLQCGDTHEEFDRWALCSIVETPAPKTFKEFQQKVNALLEVKRQIEAGEINKPEYGAIVID